MDATGSRAWRSGLCLALLAGVFTAYPSLWQARAQAYPAKRVRLVVAFTAGGGADTVGRILAQKLGESTGQSFVVDNRPGGGGNIALEVVARSDPDGYTLLNSTTTVVLNPLIYRKVPFRVDDFAAVSLVGKAPLIVVVHPSMPVRSIGELVRLARAKPGAIRFGAPTGAAGHLTMDVFRVMAGIDIRHVPYRGAPQALVDVINGQIEITSLAVPATLPLVRTGRVRALAQTGERRAAVAADIPTLEEAGIKRYAVTTWYVVFGPAGLPAAIAGQLSTEIARIVKLPDVQERLEAAGLGELIGSTPAEAAAFVQSEVVRWTKVIAATGMRAD